MLCLVQSCRIGPRVEVPDQVFPVRSHSDTQLPGSQLFVVLPLGYKIDTARHRISKTAGAYIDYIYEPGTDFTPAQAQIRQNMEQQAKQKHAHYYTAKSFQFGSSQALIYYYPTTVKGQEVLELYFGDHGYIARLTAVFRAEAHGARDTLLETMLSVYRDEDTTEDVRSIEPFTVDLGASEFAFCERKRSVFIYTVGGKRNAFVENADGFIIYLAEPLKKYPTAPDRLLALIKGGAPAAVVNRNEVKLTRIQGTQAWELQTEAVTSTGDKGVAYGVAIGDTQKPLVLCAFLYQDIDKRLKEVRAIAATLKEKAPAP